MTMVFHWKIKLFANSFHFSENFQSFHEDGKNVFESVERVTAWSCSWPLFMVIHDSVYHGCWSGCYFVLCNFLFNHVYRLIWLCAVLLLTLQRMQIWIKQFMMLSLAWRAHVSIFKPFLSVCFDGDILKQRGKNCVFKNTCILMRFETQMYNSVRLQRRSSSYSDSATWQRIAGFDISVYFKPSIGMGGLSHVTWTCCMLSKC